MDPTSARYAIRIHGHLGATVLSAFPALVPQWYGTDTVLTGLLDRSALYGVLAEVEALGLDLVEIRQLTPQRRPPEPIHHRGPAVGRYHRPPDPGALDMNSGCTHLDRIHDVTPSSWGCEDCLAQGRRYWVHLRVCQECGHVGCCDDSPGRHATAHFRSAGHPVIRSYEPGEDWYWCYVDQFAFELEGAPPAPSHP